MHLVIDVQGAQTESRFRGIGRYSLAVCDALIRQRGSHSITVVLNGMLADTIEPLRRHFRQALAHDRIVVWDALTPTAAHDPNNLARHEIAEKMREAFIRKLNPDLVLITSLFEGFGDAGVTSIGAFDTQTPTAVILYDLIPLIAPDEQFQTNPLLQNFYQRKIAQLKKASLLLAISDDTRQTAARLLGYPKGRIHTISGGVHPSFQPLGWGEDEQVKFCKTFPIQRPYVLYTGGADERKNLEKLIIAFAHLPDTIRHSHQLILAGKMPRAYQERLRACAKKHGLQAQQFILLDYVTDTQLQALYACCAVFIFPSLLEGLGMPPLEAMACGAPVIAANIPSLAEVIGLPEALFDPHTWQAIEEKLRAALTDTSFRSHLIAHGAQQIKKFSWDRTALKAFEAIAQYEYPASTRPAALTFQKTSLGIATPLQILLIKLDHLGDFVLATPAMRYLRSLYPTAQIDIVVGSWCRPLAEQLQLFRNIYTFDFFKTQSVHAPSLNDQKFSDLIEQLASPYDIAIDLRRQNETRFFLQAVRANCKVGYQTHNLAIDVQLDICLPSHLDQPHRQTPLNAIPNSEQILDLIRALPQQAGTFFAVAPSFITTDSTHGYEIALFPCAGSGIKEWPAAHFELLIERLVSEAGIDSLHLYFANSAELAKLRISPHPKIQIHQGLSYEELCANLKSQTLAIGNNSFGMHVSSSLGLVTIGIYGGHETPQEWGSPFPNAYILTAEAPCSPCHLAKQSDCPYALRCLTQIRVEDVFEKVLEVLNAITQLKKDAQSQDLELQENINLARIDQQLAHALPVHFLTKLTTCDKLTLATAISLNRPPTEPKQVFIDVSEFIQKDAKTGIQRVIKAILREAHHCVSSSFRIIPVYASTSSYGYRVASQVVSEFGSESSPALTDEPIMYSAGDIFLGLDLQPQMITAQKNFLRQMRRKGVLIKFVVYDLLPITHPHFFPSGTSTSFRSWLEFIGECDEAICISQATAHELVEFFKMNLAVTNSPQLQISHFPLGTDEVSLRQTTESTKSVELSHILNQRPTFLMVGTIEPRKGHRQALDAFEQLWAQQKKLQLLIIGKAGWLMDPFLDRIRSHAQLGHQLFWLEQANDELLNTAYQESACLLYASEGEGFGLPLIEAAAHKLPIITRDLPVFREIVHDHAYYFSGTQAQDLAYTLHHWLLLYANNEHPQSHAISFVSWQESARRLMRIVCGEVDHPMS